VAIVEAESTGRRRATRPVVRRDSASRARTATTPTTTSAAGTARDAEPRFADARLDHVAAGLSDTIGLPQSAIRARLEIQRPPRVKTTVAVGALLSTAGAAVTLAAAGMVLFRSVRSYRRPAVRERVGVHAQNLQRQS
jgi:hypothetical protein